MKSSTRHAGDHSRCHNQRAPREQVVRHTEREDEPNAGKHGAFCVRERTHLVAVVLKDSEKALHGETVSCGVSELRSRVVCDVDGDLILSLL